MFDSLRSVSTDQIVTLMALGAGACLLLLYRAGYLNLSRGSVRNSPRPPSTDPLLAELRRLTEGLRPAAQSAEPPLTRLGEPPTTQALAEQRKAVDTALAKRQAQLEDELETVRTVRGGVAKP